MSPIQFGLYDLYQNNIANENNVFIILNYLLPCLNQRDKILAQRFIGVIYEGLSSPDPKELRDFFDSPDVSTIVASYTDLYAIALTMFSMITGQYYYDTNRPTYSDFASILFDVYHKANYDTIKYALLSKGMDEDVAVTIATIMDFKRLKTANCIDANYLLHKVMHLSREQNRPAFVCKN